MTPNTYAYRKAVKLFNKEVAKAKEIFEANKDKLTASYNIKLHYASFQSEFEFERMGCKVKVELTPEMFYDFCDVSMENFESVLLEKGIVFDDITESIGQTSSFHVGGLYGDCNSLEDFLSETSNSFFELFHEFDFGLDDKGQFVEENIYDYESLTNFLLDCADLLVDEVKDSIEDLIFVIDLINTAKENQVEDFKDYVECVIFS
jgi:hypothetical protein